MKKMEDLERMEDFDDEEYNWNEEAYNEDFDFFDKKEVDCYEVTKWDWVCLDCGCVNTEHKKPRLGIDVECAECGSVFSSVCE